MLTHQFVHFTIEYDRKFNYYCTREDRGMFICRRRENPEEEAKEVKEEATSFSVAIAVNQSLEIKPNESE